MRTKLISIILFLVLVCSCIRTLPDEELTMIRTPYYGNKIRLDGYYFALNLKYNMNTNLIFYRNGVMLFFNYSSDIGDVYSNNKYIESLRKDKSSWGVYIVRNDSVIMQYWTRYTDSTIRYLVYDLQLKILNDTTLYVGSQNGDSVIYRFKHFSPKPDSTNVFIK